MRSSVSYILSDAPGESVMSHPDYSQQAQHHGCLLILVKGIGGVLKNFNKLWDRVQKVNNIKVTDSQGQIRDIWVRYVQDYPVENNDWGDFQTHRRLLGLITFSKYTNQVELNEVCRVHESLKVKYSNTLYDSRAFIFGPGTNLKRPVQEPETYSVYEDDKLSKEKTSTCDRISLPSEAAESLSSAESFSRSPSSTASYSNQEENFTTPSNFKTHAMFYGENDPMLDMEQQISDLINSLFWVVESKRLERSKEKLEKVSLLLVPFEKKDYVGLDMESRNNKKRCMGRVTKNLADLTLQAGLVADSLSLYHSAAEILKSGNDWLWLAAAKEGHCAASAILLYPNLKNSTPLQRNASLQESSPYKMKSLSLCQPSDPVRKFKMNASPSKSKMSSPVNLPSDLTPSSSESIETSSRQSELENADTESLASCSDMEYQSQKSYLTPDLPSIPRQPSSQLHNQYLLNGEDIVLKYRKAIIHYSKYQNAGIIETEACFKAARIAVEQGNCLQASSFLQNIVFINLTLSEQEKIQRFDTLAELYKDIGFLRKAAFCQRLAATRHVSVNNPNPDWQRCYYFMLHSFPGHKLCLDPDYVIQHQVGWPVLQIEVLHEIVVAARRMGHPALATRHMTYLLQTLWPHLSRLQQREFAIQLQALSAQCEGGPVPLVLETGEVIPPANLTHVPHCLHFNPRPLEATRTPHLINSKPQHGPFIFTPIHFGSLERKSKKEEGKMDHLWVQDDICEVQLKLTNPLPIELKVSNMLLLTTGIVFESIPETIILPPDSPTTVNLHGTPKEEGDLQILGYSTHTLGVKSNCRLKHMPMPNKFPASFTVSVIPSLPIISIETCVTVSGGVNVFGPDSGSTNISLYNGESTDCSIKITNTTFYVLKVLLCNNVVRTERDPTVMVGWAFCIFRISTNSHTTNWSAPISVMPPSRGRQIESQILIRYSGGEGKEVHCRESTLQFNLELLPSVSITHWDVLPAEIAYHQQCGSEVAPDADQCFWQSFGEGHHIISGYDRHCSNVTLKLGVILKTLEESTKAYHECTVVFLTPGEYKIDIQCSTTEPLSDYPSKDLEHSSITQPCVGEVSHVWRFIPPVAISVTD
ncbi:unnamed protein product [Leptidea sinapis]|uniref:Protein brunelleschi n=1 Tax=Leptidea sinapis TaxID=189913 RepID=A0A5E4QV40_9NEOP|nr:unnamed protein product [Leptidea sinapis]